MGEVRREVKSLRDEFITKVSDWQTTSSRSFVPPSKGQGAQHCYHDLNAEIEDFLTRARSEHRNPRVGLLADLKISQDLLSPSGNGNQGGMPQLDTLLEDLEGNLRTSELSPLEGPAAVSVIAVALAGGHCARMDSNPQAAGRVWRWANEHSGQGLDCSKVALLRVFDCFSKTSHGGREFRIEDLSEIAKESRSQLGISEPDVNGTFSLGDIETDKLKLHHRVLAYLVEALASLPAPKLREFFGEAETGDRNDWVYKEALCWFPPGHGFAIFHQQHARLLLSLNILPEARKEIEHALDYAKPHMLQSIEASRQMQLAIDLEDVSGLAIRKATEEAKSQIEKESSRLHGDLERSSSELLDKLEVSGEAARKETGDEIKNALLRVVEILGIFLGIVSIAVTAVGGIAAGRDALQTLIIFGAGFGSIVLLVVVIRWIVHDQPPIHFRKYKNEHLEDLAQRVQEEDQHKGNADQQDYNQELEGPENKDRSEDTAPSGQQGEDEMDGAAA